MYALDARQGSSTQNSYGLVRTLGNSQETTRGPSHLDGRKPVLEAILKPGPVWRLSQSE